MSEEIGEYIDEVLYTAASLSEAEIYKNSIVPDDSFILKIVFSGKINKETKEKTSNYLVVKKTKRS